MTERLEKAIQGDLLRELTFLKNCGLLEFERTNVFAGYVCHYSKGRETKSYIKSGAAGSSDIKIYLSGGLTLHLETKRRGATQRQTQKIWERSLKRLGHSYQICRDAQTLRSLLCYYRPDDFSPIYQRKGESA